MIPGWQMEAYERLRIEVVKSAVEDLRKAMRKSDRIGCVCNAQKALEAWFLSGWGQMLCENQGKYIVEQVRATYKSSVSKKGRRRFSDEEEQRIYKEHKDGVGYKQLSKKYKISAESLYKILRRWER